MNVTHVSGPKAIVHARMNTHLILMDRHRLPAGAGDFIAMRLVRSNLFTWADQRPVRGVA